MKKRYLALGLALLVLAATAPASGTSRGYSHPANVGYDHPFGPGSDVEREYFDFTAGADSPRFVVTSHDHIDDGTWMHVCIRVLGNCVAHAFGHGEVSMDAPEGQVWPRLAVARVWVYSAYVDNEVRPWLGTWGGIRAVWDGSHTDDVRPYIVAGYGGQVGTQLLAIPINVRLPCGDLVSAQCATVPFTSSKIRITMNDDVAANTYFEACVVSGSTTLHCMPATNQANMLAGPYPAGSKLDIRPYASVQNKFTGSKGHLIIEYFP